MQHADGRRGGRRRVSVAVLTSAMTLAAVLAVTAPANSAGRAAPGRARVSRGGANFDVRARGGAAVAPSARTARARIQLARRMGTQGVIQSDPLTGTLRMVGRLDGYLTGRSARPARAVAIGFVRSNLAAFGLTRADLKTFRLRQDYVDIAGMHHISWTQSKHGVPVFHNGLRANVTSDGRLLNVTGSPVHAIRVASTVPSIGSDEAIGAARVDGGATRRGRTGLRLRVARPVPDGTRRSTRVGDAHLAEHAAAQPVGGRRQDRCRALPSEPLGRCDRHRDCVAVLSERSGGSPGQRGEPRHVPGGRRHAPERRQRARVGGREGQQQAGRRARRSPPCRERTGACRRSWTPRNTAQNCSTSRPCTWDKSVPFSWQANMAQNAAQVMYYLNNYHDHLAGAPYGFTAAAGNFEGRRTRCSGKRWTGPTPATASRTRTTSTTPTWGRRRTASPPRCRCTCSARRTGLTTLPSVNGGDDAEVVYHEYTHGLSNRLVLYPGRHVRPLEPAGQLDGRGLERLVRRGLPEQPRVQARHGRRRRRRSWARSRSPDCCDPSRSTARSARPAPLRRLAARGARRLHVRRLRRRPRLPRGARRRRDLGWRRSGRSARRSARRSPRPSSPAAWSCRRGHRPTSTCGTRSSRPIW